MTRIKAATHHGDVLLNGDMIRSSHGVSQNTLHRALGSPRNSNRSWNKSADTQKGKCGVMEAGSLCATPREVWQCGGAGLWRLFHRDEVLLGPPRIVLS